MKTYLIIDGHNFFFRNLWGCQKQSKTTKALSKQSDVDMFEKTMLNDLFNLTSRFKTICSDIVFVEDSRAWRKDLLLQNDYKANRKVQQETIDFTNFGKATENFVKVLQSLNIKYSKVSDCEGDDLVFGWSTSIRDKGNSAIILSTDKDLTQLVGGVDDSFIIQFNPISKTVYIAEDTKNSLFNTVVEQPSFDDFKFEFDDRFKSSLKTFISQNNIVVTNPEHVRFLKVISGDSGDNVMSVYSKITDSGRRMGIGEKTAEKIYTAYKEALNEDFTYAYYFDNDGVNKLCDVIYDTCKIKDHTFTKRMLAENIQTNCKLVVLSNQTIPQYVIDKMYANIDSEIVKPSVVNKLTKELIYSESRFGKEEGTKSVIQMTGNSLKGISKDDANDMSFLLD